MRVSCVRGYAPCAHHTPTIHATHLPTYAHTDPHAHSCTATRSHTRPRANLRTSMHAQSRLTLTNAMPTRPQHAHTSYTQRTRRANLRVHSWRSWAVLGEGVYGAKPLQACAHDTTPTVRRKCGEASVCMKATLRVENPSWAHMGTFGHSQAHNAHGRVGVRCVSFTFAQSERCKSLKISELASRENKRVGVRMGGNTIYIVGPKNLGFISGDMAFYNSLGDLQLSKFDSQRSDTGNPLTPFPIKSQPYYICTRVRTPLATIFKGHI